MKYTTPMDGIHEEMLSGFFVGWPNPPSIEKHLEILSGSYTRILAVDEEQVMGFITAISDGVLSSYIPLLEVLSAYQNQGIGQELVKRMLSELDGFHMIDLLCDKKLQTYYEKLGMHKSQGMLIRNYHLQSDGSS